MNGLQDDIVWMKFIWTFNIQLAWIIQSESNVINPKSKGNCKGFNAFLYLLALLSPPPLFTVYWVALYLKNVISLQVTFEVPHFLSQCWL